jgi:metallophosphoesterase (TIGR00282 family)
MTVNILAVGDVVGNTGLDFLKNHLRSFREMKGIGFAVVNGENANVVGATPAQIEAILRAGADVVTLGNHTWVRWELQPFLNENLRVLRPLNFAPQCPGRGDMIFDTDFGPVRVVNLLGRYALDTNTDNPFTMVDALLADNQVRIVLVDMHAEATSERRAMGFFLDGRVSCVWGTHTHVQTSDAQVLPRGTGYISDLGMTGAKNSVLGIDPEQSVHKFLGDPPRRYGQAAGPGKMECAVFTVDTETGACLKVEAMRIE